jgi:hypothetical protein
MIHKSSTRARICKRLSIPGIDFASRAWRQPGGFDSLESIPGLLKRLQIRAPGTFQILADVLPASVKVNPYTPAKVHILVT